MLADIALRSLATTGLVMCGMIFAGNLTGQPVDESGSIEGTVRDQRGSEIRGASLHVSSGPTRALDQSNVKGEYRLSGLAAGTYRIIVRDDSPVVATKTVTISTGEHLKKIDFILQQAAEVTGKVTDEDGLPVSGVKVYLVGTEFRYGQVHYTFRDVATTDDLGRYRLQRVVPGTKYALLAKLFTEILSPISQVPIDMESRQPALAPTYYPRASSIATAQRLILGDDETRSDIDIELLNSHAFCIDGTLQVSGAPARLSFSIAEVEPSSGLFSGGGMYDRPATGITGSDGKIRICDLPSGEYRLTASSAPGSGLLSYGTLTVPITDEDVHDIVVLSEPQLRLGGEVRWSSEQPANRSSKRVQIRLEPTRRAMMRGETLSTSSAIPGDFGFAGIFLDNYEVHVSNLPEGVFVHDILYGGSSIKHGLLQMSSRIDPRLVVSLSNDGSSVQVVAQTRDGSPLTEGFIVIVPVKTGWSTEVADSMVTGPLDQYGRFSSPVLATGTYHVISTRLVPQPVPEFIELLLQNRRKGKQVEVATGQDVSVRVEEYAF